MTGRRTSLVIADDNQDLRELLALGLASQGYVVRCAEDGESCWQNLLSAPFDLLITDLEMPQLNGLDLLRRMRTYAFHQPAILISGNLPPLSPEIEKLLSPGAALAKPLSFADLLPLIEGLLDITYRSVKPRRGNCG